MAARAPLSDEDLEAQRARGAALLEQCREDARRWRRTVAVAVGGGLVAWVAGIGLLSWAVHTTNVELGGIAFWAGLLIGNVGVVAAMLWLGGQVEKHGH